MPSDAPPPHRLHPASLVFHILTVARTALVPAVPLSVLAWSGEGFISVVPLLILGASAAGSVIWGTARLLSFRYRLDAEGLTLHEGIVSRRHRMIPRTRVQSVDVRQSALQRLFGLAELHIETAGSSQADRSLIAFGRTGADAILAILELANAEALAEAMAGREEGRARTEVTDAAPQISQGPVRPAEATAIGVPEGSGAMRTPSPGLAAEAAAAQTEPVARVSTGELALAGATANEIGVVAALIAGGLQFLEGLPLPIPDPYERLGLALAGRWEAVQNGAAEPDVIAAGIAVGATLLAAVFLLLLAGWLASIASSVARFHNFRLERTGAELRQRYGLLSRRTATIPVRRIQVMRIEESLLRRPLERAVLRVGTAGAAPGQAGGAETYVPLARRAEVPRLVGAVHGDVDYGRLQFQRVHPRARRRIFMRHALVLAGLTGATVWAYGLAGTSVLALLPLAFGLADRQYHSRGYALAPGYVAARAGFLNRVTWLIPDGRVQTLHITESPFQRRFGLATLLIDTAGGRGGTARIIDLSREEAVRLQAILERRVRWPASAREHRPTESWSEPVE